MSTVINDSHFFAKGFLISTDKNLLDFDVIYNYLDQESYWAKGVPAERLRRAIANSMCFGVYHNKKQIGFARMITDKATFGYLADVFILEEYRRQGLSKWLVQTITQHPELEGLRRWSLATRDAHSLYAQFGFTPVDKPEIWMQIYQPYQTTVNQS
ncbi:GNAT family N-acetyltransferase [Mucilaginibacter sp. PPCGB 2223]|uniref:GNAT family N-acetyltransferase n=1 Tax=Mucilaginibacter sp. PPCGB 2223 TaxID=1886027 RepID=UPI000826CD6C|nr:GNAT family N-acetyltransferase [Mucilaginibacter sp. PPCGB 2223]OCX53595.1 GNAT family N-acetyltransferase [Mucilaginibacter sp. PPCGB 2223]